MKKKTNIKKPIIAIIIMVAVIVLALYMNTIDLVENNNNNNIVDNGENFNFLKLDGTTDNLRNYRGKIVVLEIWASWNEICEIQTINLKPLYDNHNDIVIMSLNIDENETDILAYKTKLENQYSVSLDWIFGDSDSLFPYLDRQGIPSICIFDKQGNVAFKHTGLMFYEKPLDWQDVEDQSIFQYLLKDEINKLS